jgi:anti-sigma regulatory factor (Ser/Thr protein kinase)
VQAENKGVALAASFPSRELFAWCDARKLERVMINLVGNAIKFTDAGGAIHVAVSECSRHPGMTCMSVEDNGLGIPREALAKISQRYFRVGQHVTGSGLGLSISREILEMHGGRLDVESPPPGKPCGTIVYVHLPQTEPPSVVLHTPREDAAARLLGLLEAGGYRAVRVRGGEEVEAFALSQQADLFIVDTRGLSSPDLLLRLRGDPRCQRLPMLALAGTRDAAPADALLDEILRKIAVPVLRQPWEPAKFLRKVSAAFSSDIHVAPPPNPQNHKGITHETSP